MIGQCGVVDECKVLAPHLATEVMLLPVVLVKVIKVVEDLEFYLASALVPPLLAHLFADITLEMRFPEMVIEGIVIVEELVVAVVAGGMFLFLVLGYFITSIHLLLKEEYCLIL